MMKPPLSQGIPDDFQTPPAALTPLLPYLRKDAIIWECASGKGNLYQALLAKGYAVLGTDILSGTDFISYTPDMFDIIVTNPPFSLKDEFLERAYSLGRPFAFLLPLTSFEGKKRQALFAQNGIQVLLLDGRINYETPSGKGTGSWFMSAWFCWRLLPAQICYGTINTKLSRHWINKKSIDGIYEPDKIVAHPGQYNEYTATWGDNESFVIKSYTTSHSVDYSQLLEMFTQYAKDKCIPNFKVGQFHYSHDELRDIYLSVCKTPEGE